MGKRELVTVLSLSSWCLVIAVWLFVTVPRVCLQLVIMVVPGYTHFFDSSLESSAGKYLTCDTKSLISRPYRLHDFNPLCTSDPKCVMWQTARCMTIRLVLSSTLANVGKGNQ